MENVTIDTAELVEIRFTVIEDDLTYMGTFTYAKDEVPDQATIDARIASDFAKWKLVIRPEGA
jgi:hypothetical protein